MDSVATYRTASEGNDLDALVELLGSNAELVSPLSGRMIFRGRDDLKVLLDAVYGSVTDLRWNEHITDGHTHLVIGDCRVGRLHLGDAMVLELNADGSIARIRPHLRPWLATTFFALRVGARLARHPGVLWRALHSS